MEAKTVLEIKGISKYFGKHKVIDNVSLDIKEGEIYGFLGPNGAGKTTTIKMILGLLSIDEGSIRINGYDVKKQFEQAMTYIGGIVENPDMYGYMSGLDNLKLYAKMRDVDQKRIDEIVEIVGLKQRIKDKVSKYSLGMKQRLGLALTLLHNPRVLILDEPTNGLDPEGIKTLRGILKKIAKEEKIAVFVSSHLLSEMQLMCDKIAVIDKGKLIKTENIKNETEQEEKQNYEIEAKPLEQAKRIIEEKWQKEIKVQEEKLCFMAQKEEMPQMVKEFVDAQIKVYSITVKEKSLEDTFFNITKEGNDHA